MEVLEEVLFFLVRFGVKEVVGCMLWSFVYVA